MADRRWFTDLAPPEFLMFAALLEDGKTINPGCLIGTWEDVVLPEHVATRYLSAADLATAARTKKAIIDQLQVAMSTGAQGARQRIEDALPLRRFQARVESREAFAAAEAVEAAGRARGGNLAFDRARRRANELATLLTEIGGELREGHLNGMAKAVSICDDKRMTRRIVAAAGVTTPASIRADSPSAIDAALAAYGRLVVKPARGEQGQGVAVGLKTMSEVQSALIGARRICSDVLIEEQVQGEDLRLVIIDFQLAAAAVRRPPRVIGDGQTSIRRLIELQSRRRSAATGGESRIPIDAETERTLAEAGFALDDVAPDGVEVMVRKAANLHLGGTIHDVTDIVHPVLVDAAIAAARAIDIPVTGIDLMVKAPDQPDYAFIEANERPGLANHEPQPTAERFIDLLFPASASGSPRSNA